MATERSPWLDKISQAEERLRPWRTNSKKIVKRYRGHDEEQNSDNRFNLHWSNVELFSATVYNRTPKPEVERRWKDSGDPVSRDLAEIMQASLQFNIDAPENDFDGIMERVMTDFGNTGFGQIRLKYKPYFEEGPPTHLPVDVTAEYDARGEVVNVARDQEGQIVEEYQTGPEGAYIEGEPEENLVYEEVGMEFVPWYRFIWDTDATQWEEVEWCAIRYELTKAQIEKQFGKKVAKNIKYEGKQPDERELIGNKAVVYEVFDKVTRTWLVVSNDYKENKGVIEREKDPWELESFFPFPKPLFATITSDKMIPVPYYLIVQDLFEELDETQRRINHLISMLKVRGFYDSSLGDEFANVLRNDDGHLEPITNWAGIVDQNNGKVPFTIMEIGEIYGALQELRNQRMDIKNQIYEVSGFSDIIRGNTRASETATAQEIKKEYATLRMNRHIKNVNRFVRDVVRIMGELIAEHFQPETIQLITGQAVSPEMMETLRNDIQRAYKIDIEIDSMLAENEELEQQGRMDFLNAVAQFVGGVMPMLQAGMIDPAAAKELVMFAARSFKRGRKLERVLEALPVFNQPAAPANPGMAQQPSGQPAGGQPVQNPGGG